MSKKCKYRKYLHDGSFLKCQHQHVRCFQFGEAAAAASDLFGKFKKCLLYPVIVRCFQFGEASAYEFFWIYRKCHITVDFQNVNINMSGASSLETLLLLNFFGNSINVNINFLMSAASSLERVPLPNFFGDIENVHMNMMVDFQKVNINTSGASSLEHFRYF